MHEVTVAEVLAGPAQAGPGAAEHVQRTMLRVGVGTGTRPIRAPDIALMRAGTGLPIPECPVILSAGGATDGDAILTLDDRLAAEAREPGSTVLPWSGVALSAPGGSVARAA